jgi:2'-5' RNA ligase
MGKHGWAWIKLPESVAKKMTDFGKIIPKEDLHENGREHQPHITLKYGMKTDDYSLVRECLDGKSGGKAHLGVSSIFENDEYDVVKVTCAGAALHRLHKLMNQLPHDDNFMVYKPHATIAYVKKGLGKKYAGEFLVDEEFEFDTVWYKKPEGTRSIPIRLSSYKKAFNLSKYVISEDVSTRDSHHCIICGQQTMYYKGDGKVKVCDNCGTL